MMLGPDIIACAQIVERGDPSRFAATMAAPVAARARLFPIYAFNVEVARAPWLTAESMIAEMRLQWWRDVLEEIRSGGPVRRHEVATPLSEVLDAEGATLLDASIEARRWDIYRDPFDDMKHFRKHLTHTSGHLLLAAARTLGDAPADPLLKAGFAQGVANWLRAVPELERQGRIPLIEGTPEAIQALAQDGLNALSEAKSAQLPNPIQPALLALYETQALLRKVVQNPNVVAANALAISPFQSKLALLRRSITKSW